MIAPSVQCQELEAQLQKLASGGGPRSLEAEGAARALRARCEKLEAEVRKETLELWQFGVHEVLGGVGLPMLGEHV